MNLSCLDGAAVRFSFTASRTAVQGMQPLLRADLGRRPAASKLEIAIREAVANRGVSVVILAGDVAMISGRADEVIDLTRTNLWH
jgi:hypothetical protein